MTSAALNVLFGKWDYCLCLVSFLCFNLCKLPRVTYKSIQCLVNTEMVVGSPREAGQKEYVFQGPIS